MYTYIGVSEIMKSIQQPKGCKKLPSLLQASAAEVPLGL